MRRVGLSLPLTYVRVGVECKQDMRAAAVGLAAAVDAGLYRAGVHVESYESGNIVHREPPSMSAAWPLAVWTPLLSA